MITDWLLNLIASAWEGFISSIPSPPSDSWMSQIGSAISWVVDGVNSLGPWVPLPLLAGILGTITAVWVIGAALKVLRIAFSMFTGGGGSAA